MIVGLLALVEYGAFAAVAIGSFHRPNPLDMYSETSIAIGRILGIHALICLCAAAATGLYINKKTAIGIRQSFAYSVIAALVSLSVSLLLLGVTVFLALLHQNEFHNPRPFTSLDIALILIGYILGIISPSLIIVRSVRIHNPALAN